MPDIVFSLCFLNFVLFHFLLFSSSTDGRRSVNECIPDVYGSDAIENNRSILDESVGARIHRLYRVISQPIDREVKVLKVYMPHRVGEGQIVKTILVPAQ